MEITNRQRLDNLRIDIIRLFRATGRDIQGFLEKPEQEWNPQDVPIHSYVDNSGGETAIAIGIPHNPSKDRELARTLKDQYGYAFSICTSKERLMEDGVKIADRLIAKWGDAQMLLMFPDLVDDETPDIQADIKDMLTRVSQRLEIFKTPRTPKSKERAAEFFEAIKGMGIDDVTRVQLDAAEDVLYEVEKTAKAMLFERSVG